MTTIINQITTNFTSSTPYNAISNGMAAIAVVLLLALLTEKVLLDAYEDKPSRQHSPAFMIVMLPFFIVMAVMVFLRMAQILHL